LQKLVVHIKFDIHVFIVTFSKNEVFLNILLHMFNLHLSVL
jgi:hypothetical protein